MRNHNQTLNRIFASQHALIDRNQALQIGLSPTMISNRLCSGEWVRVHRGVYRLSGSPPTPDQALLAACLAGGTQAVASHRSAAWLWGLLEAPPLPEITVPRHRHPVLHGVRVHRANDLDGRRTIVRRSIPCCDAVRALLDMAAVADAAATAGAVDSALARNLLTSKTIEAEIARRSQRGRRGCRALRDLLIDRGVMGGPSPSVLEADALRLFKRWGLPVLNREVRFYPDGRYRIDFLITRSVAVEVDGFAHHWSPEAKRHDEQRRNRLRLDGLFLLVYTWRDIHSDPRRVAGEIRAAIGKVAA